MKVIENQGFFRLSEPRKSKNENAFQCKPDFFQGAGLFHRSQEYEQDTQANIITPAFTKRQNELEEIQQPDESQLVMDLRKKLNEKEVELLGVRNEKMKLEMLADATKKELKVTTKRFEEFKQHFREESNGISSTQSETHSKLQKLMKIQQQSHAETIAKLKEKVIF